MCHPWERSHTLKSRPADVHDERGTAAVEFALVSVILLMIVFGIIEFGKTYSQYEVYINAAREGARVGAVRNDQTAIRNAVVNAAAGYPVNTSGISITVNNSPAGPTPCTDDTTGQSLAVAWNQPMSISIPFLPAWNPTVAIRGVFQCE
jgi:Flp pilus assembly protein TadG